MKLGIIGLGKMGLNMSERLIKGGHKVIGYARHVKTVDSAIVRGVEGAYSLEELIQNLNSPRIVWLMIPAGETVDNIIQELIPMLDQHDLIIDGGNSNYKDTVRRSTTLKQRSIDFVDVGTSGGVWGLEEGYSMMIGGEKEIVDSLRPIFETLAPSSDKGWDHVGPNGAGHFVKMVHNGIEYGLMQAYAEGFSIMKQKKDFELDLHKIAEIWRYGSVVRSWLLDLTSEALSEDSDLHDIEPFVAESGEGRWTLYEAFDLEVAAPVIAQSLLQRVQSRDKERFTEKLLAIMRKQFGGHALKRKE
jgi:6-phosphogluconate dehydrogenase